MSFVAASVASEPARVSIEFLADGRCLVSAKGEGFHSELTYLPQTRVPPTSEFRCAVPPVPEGRPIDLFVTLPRGAAPSGDDTPRLKWIQHDDRWVGMASLPTAPSVVIVPESGNRLTTSAWWVRVAGVGVAIGAVVAVIVIRRQKGRGKGREP
jgi:hypothetical protein